MSESEWLEVFDLHDAQLKGCLPRSEVMNVVYSCGKLVTKPALTAALAKQPDPMPRTAFAAFMRELPDSASDSDILAALQAFDSKESGTLSKMDMQTIFTSMDEAVERQDFDRLMHDAPIEGVNYNIAALCSYLKQPHTAHKASVVDVKALKL